VKILNNIVMNYRKIYENECGIELDSNTEVHHLDCDRNNNDIMNLVALPIAIHNKLHKLKHNYDSSIEIINDCKYLYAKEKIKAIDNISNWIEFKSNILSMYVNNRDSILCNNNKI
jgi:hypothetical protein